jgi:hypothetical protein
VRVTTSVASYDEIADWYVRDFLARSNRPGEDPLGIGRALSGLLGTGAGAFFDAGLTLERFAEGGGPVPVVLAVRARKL